MIWIIGEYADRIENADELLESFLEAFPRRLRPCSCSWSLPLSSYS